ncbi:MmgE/PrpD family protein [Sulfobacillus harzensis]|uniref:MmgE/PrpD family protein n=1 Tax=Sulfobacillus harzensis TaxID=2729629 RepID=A0A7Y0L5F9_9FIRM|nr:MmgE/PrpD family protein [Sulfobacillus harzensis]NMP23652.1 MmgE/PrpD family protein [Sulfobacillus harzensis]
MSDETRQLAQYGAKTSQNLWKYPGAREMAEEAVLDWVACTIAGAPDIRIAPLFRMAKPRTSGNAWIAGHGDRGHPLDAAFLNGASSHVLELDDIERTAYIHPGVATVAAAMALADDDPALDTDTFLRAVVVGYEVAIRVGRSVNPSHYEMWHTTGTAGSLGAAAAASVILDLNEEETTWALGNAGTEAAGLWQFNADGALTKPYHVGMAALHGVMAALAAREGFSGAHRILEGEQGMLRAMSREPKPALLTEGLGDTPPAILGISRKRWASCRFTHPSIDAVMALRDPGRSHEVESVLLRTFNTAIRVAGHPNPKTPQEAKFSMRYCSALAWVSGDVGIHSFASIPINGEVQDFFEKIHVEESTHYNALMPEKMPGAVTITWRDGSVSETEVLNPEGDPENPIVGKKLDAKVHSMLRGMLADSQIQGAIAAARRSQETARYREWISHLRLGANVQ